MARTDPLTDRLVVVFGGSGFIGHYVAQELLERGARVRIASRHPEKAFELKPLANLGQLQFARCDVTNEASVEASMHGADFVVNLVGSFEGNLRQLMGNAAGKLAQAAKDAGARAFVHLSAIAEDPDGEAEYAQAKALGEKLVTEAFPQATILRPSILFGEDDNFLTMFADLIRLFPVLPVFAPDSPLQMVYVGDVADAVVAALADPGAHGGKTFELGGPEKVTMMELNRRIAEAQGRKRTFIPMPDALSAGFAAMPGTPMGSDQWTLLKNGNVASGDHPGFAELDISPRPLGLFLDRWMVTHRKHGRFSDRVRQV
ncbi:complex I NDUFA9 subunit family protein [Qipengyuania sp. JC766]|uniref:complex I NDUFA9 subunit family protein n=1 Tax=Qipengyuania sp. JC766 TaxID=3232139 RepID=UPI003459A730